MIADALVAHGVNRLYTFPGGTLAPIYDECVRKGVELFCAYHEQGAGYAALAESRLSRQVQVVAVTSGPGVTNLTTPVADAFFDSTPLVALTGQVGTGDVKSGRPVRQCGFQQVDTTALMTPISKAVFFPASPDELADCLREGFATAQEGRPGPVVIDLPMDVQLGKLTADPRPLRRELALSPTPKEEVLDQAAKILAAAERPVIFAGQGVLLSRSNQELRLLVERRKIPVVMSLLGLGAVPTQSTLALGFCGHTGNQTAGMALQHADVVLVVGARLDVRQTGNCVDQWVPNGQVIRIDLDQDELAFPRVRTDLTIHSDAHTALQALNKKLDGKALCETSAWRSQIDRWRREYSLYQGPDRQTLRPQHILEAANAITAGRRAVILSGVGLHQQWAARHFDFDFPDRAWLTSGGHGAMGYDLPSAIGAQMARPDDLVLCIDGDGSLQINIQELQSVVANELPIKIIVLDNSRLGMVSQFQLHNWKSDPTTGNKKNPDFVAVAEAYGIKAFRLATPGDVEPVLSDALQHNGPALVHCLIGPEENCVPMLMAGQPMDKMWPYFE